MKILTCDDHSLFREGLRYAIASLDSARGAELLDASTAAEAIATAEAHPDLALALIDLGLPDASGLSLIDTFRSRFPHVGIVVISGSEAPGHVRSVLDAGALGFIPKSHDREALLRALGVVLQGGIYAPASAMAGAPLPKLTERQREVMRLIAKGLTNREIADALSISANTAKHHVAAVLTALDVTNRAEAVRVMIDQGLIDPTRE